MLLRPVRGYLHSRMIFRFACSLSLIRVWGCLHSCTSSASVLVLGDRGVRCVEAWVPALAPAFARALLGVSVSRFTGQWVLFLAHGTSISAFYTMQGNESPAAAQSSTPSEDVSSGHRQAGVSTRRRLAQRTSTVLSPCLLYTSPSPRDRQKSRMPSSA